MTGKTCMWGRVVRGNASDTPCPNAAVQAGLCYDEDLVPTLVVRVCEDHQRVMQLLTDNQVPIEVNLAALQENP